MMQSNISEYWNGKEERAILAQKHTEEMQEKYSTQINNSINNSTSTPKKYTPLNNFYNRNQKKNKKN